MNKRYKLLIKAKRDNDPADWALYKASRNKVISFLRKVERRYWQNEPETALGKIWNVSTML